MADKPISDLLMKIVDFDDQPISGEAMTQLPTQKSDMLKGFKEKYMFELTKFSFKTGLGGTEGDAESRKAKGDSEKQAASRDAERQQKFRQETDAVLARNENNKRAREANKSAFPLDDPLPVPLKVKSAPKTQGFNKFRTNQNTDSTRYPVDLKPIEFNRLVDRTSPVLLARCISRQPFKSATLIKRKPTGGPSSGEVFLRIDFNYVLLKSVEWTNDTPIEEEIEFICRGITLNYKPQLPDGSLGAAISVFWKSPLDANTSITQETLQGS